MAKLQSKKRRGADVEGREDGEEGGNENSWARRCRMDGRRKKDKTQMKKGKERRIKQG